MMDNIENFTDLSYSFSASISLDELDDFEGRPRPSKPITSLEVLKHIAKLSDQLPGEVSYKLVNDVATIEMIQGRAFVEGTCTATKNGFDVSLVHNIPIPRFAIRAAIVDGLSWARHDISQPHNVPQIATGDYVRIKGVHVNARSYGFRVEWKLGPYKDRIVIKGRTGLTRRWHKVFDEGVDGVLKVKIYARLKTENTLCVKVEARGPFGWKEKHQDCIKF